MNINIWGKDIGRLGLYKSDETMLTLIKSRKKSVCGGCDRTISAKSYCLGGGYHKICLNCYEKFLNNLIKSLDDYKEQIKNLMLEIKSKDKMLLKNNILAKVEDTGQEA